MAHIVFVGGSRLLRGGLKTILEEAGDMVVAEYASTDEVLRPKRHTEEQAVYLLKHPTGTSSIRDQIAALRKAHPGCRVAVLVERLSSSELVEVFAAGGDGLVLEEIGAQALHESLKLIQLGEKVFPSQLAPLLAEGRRPGPQTVAPRECSILTARELEIVGRLRAGLSNKEIAIELDLAVATVKVHVKSLLKKLGLNNRTQAAIWAMETGVAERPQVTNHLTLDEAEAGGGRAHGNDHPREARLAEAMRVSLQP